VGKASRAKRERPGGAGTGERPAPAGAAAGRLAPPGGGAVPPSPGETPASRWWEIPLPLALILLGAAIFRAVYFHFYTKTSIFFDGLILDSEMYDAWAKAIAAGDWVGKEVFYFPPLYPYALGLLFRAAGHSYALVYLAQQLLGLLSLVLLYRVAGAVFGPQAALWAAAGAALYGPFAFFETKVLSTSLGLALNLVALLALVRVERAAPAPGPRGLLRWLAAGAAIGLAAICLPATILLALLYAAARFLRRDPAGAAALLAGAFVALSPILAHNLAVAGDPLFLSAQGGITFYQGNNPHSRGLYDVVPGFSGAPELQAQEEKTIAEREAGRPLKRSEISSHFFHKGLAFIASSPGAWIALEFRKLAALFGDYEASTEYSLYLEREQIPWLRLALLPFAAIAGLGLVGFALCGGPGALAALAARRPGAAPRERASGALALYALYAALVPLLFYVSSRYRLPLAPALLVYAAAFVSRLRDFVRAGAPLGARETGGLLAALVIALVSFFPLGEKSVTAEANVYYNIGNLLADRGRQEEALRSFDRSLADWPTNTFALINRGNSLDRLGRSEEALASYHRAEEAKPDFFKAYTSQGTVLHKLGRHEEEVAAYRRSLPAGGAQAHYLLAGALQETRRLDEAWDEIQAALRSRPGDPRFLLTLGAILEGQRRTDDAVEAYRSAIKADPKSAKARFSLGLLYRELGQITDARKEYQEGLLLDPRNAQAHARLADLHALLGDPAQARQEYRTALSIDPQEPLAREGLKRLGPGPGGGP
jgi:tetratricopeptide (TPR) repeat protein